MRVLLALMATKIIDLRVGFGAFTARIVRQFVLLPHSVLSFSGFILWQLLIMVVVV